ncbi:MAG: DUF4412 domain-containing protein [Chthoniobacterales bacterium]
MKKLLLTLCLFSVSTAFADLIVVQEMEQPGAQAQKMEMPMKIKGDKIRMDMGPQASSILDMKSGGITMLMHPGKTYMVIPAETVKMMSAQMRQQKEATPKSTEKPQPTGKKQNINGFDTEEYILKTKDGTITLWLAKNVPNQQLLVEQFKKMNDIGGQGGMPEVDYTTLPGFPIRIEVANAGKPVGMMTIRSIQEVNLPESDFQPPVGFKETKMPAMPK